MATRLCLSLFVLLQALPCFAQDLMTGTMYLPAASGWKLSPDGKAIVDTKKWRVERYSDGSEVFSYIPSPKERRRNLITEAKRALVRVEGELRSVTAYQVGKKGDKEIEQSASVTFRNGFLQSITSCEDDGSPLGRSCLTATRKLCPYIQVLKTPTPKEKLEELFARGPRDEVEKTEVRAMATILAMRGTMHQLENISKRGNRMGLKDPKQTTTGKITGNNIDPKAVDRLNRLCMGALTNPEPIR